MSNVQILPAKGPDKARATSRTKFGRLPYIVSKLGLGTYHLTSDRYVSHEEALSLILSALDSGINVVDTAPLYGVGEAEQIVGEALSEHQGESPLLINKIGRFEKSILTRVAAEAYNNPSLMLAQLQHSLRVLNVDSIPLLLLHETDWPEWGLHSNMDKAPVWKFLEEAKDMGLVESVGLSVRNSDRAEALCATGRFDAMLYVHYHNLVWQGQADGALRAAATNNMGVAIGAPYRQGLLTSDDPDLGRRLREERRPSVPPGIIRRIEKAQRIAADHEISILELGLRWLVGDSRVHTTLIGPRTVHELRQNLEWASKGPLPTDVQDAIRSLADIPAGSWV